MRDDTAKIMIEKKFMQFELNLQNNYKDLAYEEYLEVHAMLDSFFEQDEISKWFYGRMKRKLRKKYDWIYQPEEESEESEEA